MKAVACQTLSFVCLLIVFTSTVGCRTIYRMQTSGALVYVDGRPRINLLAVKQQRKTDCGIACLSGVLKYWGEAIPADEIGEFLGEPPEAGYTLAQIKTYAEHAGFAAFLIEGSFEELQRQCDLGRPCIICVQNWGVVNHSVVVYEVTRVGEDYILCVMDPSSGRTMRFSGQRIKSRWEAIGRPMLVIGKREGTPVGEP